MTSELITKFKEVGDPTAATLNYPFLVMFYIHFMNIFEVYFKLEKRNFVKKYLLYIGRAIVMSLIVLITIDLLGTTTIDI